MGDELMEDKPAYTVKCDFAGCQETYSGAFSRPDAATASAVQNGWLVKMVNGKSKDYCPAHRGQAPETKDEELARLRKENFELKGQPK